MDYYIARHTIGFSDGSTHVRGRCYFPKPVEKSYFIVNEDNYQHCQLKTLEVDSRIMPCPNHCLGYTKSYLLGWMEASEYSPSLFTKWIAGQTVGVSDENETVYYYNDVVRYFTRGGVLAEVED